MTMRLTRPFTLFMMMIAVALAGCGGGSSSSDSTANTANSTPVDQPYSDPVNYSGNGSDSLAQAPEAAAVTHHQITLNGTTISYTAYAGHLTALAPKTGAPEASIFYVAYIADNQNAATRPLTFLYNGGPGSASIWLHMGSFGPKRLVSGDPSATPVTPFPLVDNQESLLNTTDLVFVDAVGTGYSEAIAPNTNQTFWGVDADANVFRDFVQRYLTVNQRTSSPLFLFGESYGTTRTAVLASALEASGVSLKGIALQSSILNYNSNCAMFGQEQVSCAGYLPTYAAIGDYYQLDTPAPTSLLSYLLQARSFTESTYAPAVQQYLPGGSAPPLTNYAALITQLVNGTGANASLWSQTQLDLDPTTYQNGLLPGTVIGRYDARVAAPSGSALAQGGDPSSNVITAPFTSAFQQYLPSFLQYTNSANASYAVMNNNAIDSWNFGHDGLALPDAIPDLATALTLNPKLQVLSLNGYDDLATPFYQTEIDLARLGNVSSLQITHYVGGHMIYLDDTSRPLEKADLLAFYQRAMQ